MKVAILQPRFDVPFKPALVAKPTCQVTNAREHWRRFVAGLDHFHRQRGDDVTIIERPNWQFNPEVVRLLGADLTYIPHKMKSTFDCGDMEVRYYMQTVMPSWFWVDAIGFQSQTEHYPFTVGEVADDTWMKRFQQEIAGGKSKFEQPETTTAEIPVGAIFFACQIPHDESIRYHSDFGVEETLAAILKWATNANVPVAVKGHPINPGSMAACEKLVAESATGIWVQGNIHDLIEQCQATYIVNSGVGMEAMLHHKPVVCFGRADYDQHVLTSDLSHDSLDRVWKEIANRADEFTSSYADFFHQWGEIVVDSRAQKSYSKIRLPDEAQIKTARRLYFSNNPDMTPPRIFIGSGEASMLERKTLMYSLRKNASRDVELNVFNGTHNSVEHEDDPPVLAPLSLRLKYKNFTEFSLYRYLIPELCGHTGRAIYLDSDMVCIGDIAELFDCDMKGADFLATPHYGENEWGTSVMLINCETCRFDLEQIFDEIEAGKYSYSDFSNMNPKFLEHHPMTIGELDPNWNVFDKHDDATKLIHYTNLTTQPWKFPGHEFGELWFEYFNRARKSGLISEDDIEKQILRGYVRGDIREGNTPANTGESKGLLSRIFGS